MGVQLDATHHILNSKVKEVTQLMSALAQNPDTADKANEMYDALANVVKDAAEKYYEGVKDVDQEKLEKLYKNLSNDLAKGLSRSATSGLAQVIAETFDYGKALPFSNQNFFGEFIKTLVTKMNEDFIIRYYPGSGCVLLPSHETIQIFEDAQGNTYTQNDLIKLAINDYNKDSSGYFIVGSETGINNYNLTTDQIINSYLSKKFPDDKILASQAQLGDTIDGNYLNSLDKYYKFKNQYKDADVTVTKNYNHPRDLKPIQITFDVARKSGLFRKNLFDLDPVRLKYLSSTEDNETFKQFKSYFSEVSDEELQKKLNIWTQRNLQLISRGRTLKSIPTDLEGNLDFKTYFGNDELTSIVFDDYASHYMSDTVSEPIFSYQKKAAELIMGNIYGDVFKTGMDSLSEIREEGAGYFKNKLAQIYKFEKGSNADFKIATVDGEPDVYVKFVQKGELPKENLDRTRNLTSVDYDKAGNLVKYRLDQQGEKLYRIPDNASVKFTEKGYDILYVEAGETRTSKKGGEKTSYFEMDKTVHNTVNDILRSFNSSIQGIVPIMNNT